MFPFFWICCNRCTYENQFNADRSFGQSQIFLFFYHMIDQWLHGLNKVQSIQKFSAHCPLIARKQNCGETRFLPWLLSTDLKLLIKSCSVIHPLPFIFPCEVPELHTAPSRFLSISNKVLHYLNPLSTPKSFPNPISLSRWHHYFCYVRLLTDFECIVWVNIYHLQMTWSVVWNRV